MRAADSRRQLLPHPAAESSQRIMLVKGEPDKIAARSQGLPAIAVPGATSWRTEWASFFMQHEITIVRDCDQEGRAAAERISHDLGRPVNAAIVDLAPGRSDGYDLTDWLTDNTSAAQTSCRRHLTARGQNRGET